MKLQCTHRCKRHERNSQTERGAAMLVAMLILALVASLASAALWKQWQNIEREDSLQKQTQVNWLMAGAFDWARLILREDARSDQQNAQQSDNLNEAWALPLKEARLSTFLALDKNSNADLDLPVFLSGSALDAQSKLNIRNLFQNSTNQDVENFERLFQELNLPRTELNTLIQTLRNSQANSAPLSLGGNSNASLPLPIQELGELLRFGISQETFQVLSNFIALLPVHSPVNLNTASLEVLVAIGMQKNAARDWIVDRRSTPLKSAKDLERLKSDAFTPNEKYHSSYTRFFLVTGRIRMDQLIIEEQALIERGIVDGKLVSMIWRRRSASI